MEELKYSNNIYSENGSQPENEKEASSNKRYSSKFLALVLVMAIVFSSIAGSIFGFMAGSVGQQLLPKLFKNNSALLSPDSPSPDVVKQRIIQEDSAVVDVVDRATPAVVSIAITKDVPRMRNFFDPFGLEDFFGTTPDPGSGSDNGSSKQKVGGGTGFVVTPDGMIVTNKHVVSDTQADYTVIMNDGKEYPAKVLARDPINDLAVIKIEGSDFPIISFGQSDSLKIGQTVIAIGNSLGEFSNTVSRGIISGLRRNVTAGSTLGESERLTNIIQTDAAINPGNSGGPLLNISGEVIGVNVAMAQGAQSIGFAIPASQIIRVVDQVKETGKISVPYLGVRYVLIDKTIQKENNLSFDYGALVARGEKMTDLAVIPGGPADKAGIVENDIILEINGTKINQNNGLGDLITEYRAGEEITVKVWHRGETKDVKVKLEERK